MTTPLNREELDDVLKQLLDDVVGVSGGEWAKASDMEYINVAVQSIEVLFSNTLKAFADEVEREVIGEYRATGDLDSDYIMGYNNAKSEVADALKALLEKRGIV